MRNQTLCNSIEKHYKKVYKFNTIKKKIIIKEQDSISRYTWNIFYNIRNKEKVSFDITYFTNFYKCFYKILLINVQHLCTIVLCSQITKWKT